MRNLRFFFFVLCGFFTALSLGVARNTEWSLHADVNLESVYFPSDLGEPTTPFFQRLSLLPNYRWKYKEDLRFVFKGDFTWDPLNNSTEEQVFMDVPELFLKYNFGSFSAQAGYAVFNWGVTDGYNPLDVLNSKQYYDPLHAKKLGAPSLSVNFSGLSWSVDGIYIPQQKSSLMPGPQSRWLPRDVFIPETPTNDLVLLLPEDLRYHYGSRESLDRSRENNFALRLQRRGSSTDFSMMAYEGLNSFPLVQPVVTGTIEQVSPKTVIAVDPDVTLNLKDYRQRLFGLSVVHSKWDMLFKYAGSYNQPLGDHPLLPGWMQENIMALERSFNVGSSGLLIMVLQYSFIHSERANDSNLSFSEIFRDAWMIGGRLSWQEVWTLNGLALYDNNRYSQFAELSLSRRLRDVWILRGTANFFSGPETSPLGIYSKNNSYTLTLSRSF